MSPRIGIAASLSSPTKKVGASAPPTPTSTAGVLASITIAGNQANTMISQLTVQSSTTGGKVLNASLQNGKTLTTGALMNGTGTFTVTRAAAGLDPAVTSTATCYVYYSTLINASTTGYYIAPTEDSSGLTYGNATEFDLATDFAADISAQAPFSMYTATLQIGAFSFNVTVDSVLHNCTASNTVTSNTGLVLPA